MRDLLTEDYGPRGDGARSLPLRESARVRAARLTSRVRTRWFDPAGPVPPLTHPAVLLREEGSIIRTLAVIAAELEAEGFRAHAYDVRHDQR